jgi:hypothetical protein
MQIFLIKVKLGPIYIYIYYERKIPYKAAYSLAEMTCNHMPNL